MIFIDRMRFIGLLKLFSETMESLGREDLLVMLSHLPEVCAPYARAWVR